MDREFDWKPRNSRSRIYVSVQPTCPERSEDPVNMPVRLKQRFIAAAIALLPLYGGIGIAQAGPSPETICGDTNGDGSITATDALVVLVAALDLPSPCTPLSCDVIGDVDGITASDHAPVILDLD